MKTRTLQFARSTVRVEPSGERPTCIVDFIFRDIPEVGAVVPQFTYRLAESQESGALDLYSGEELELHTTSDRRMAAHLMERTSYHLADQSRGGLLLHAAGVGWGSSGLVIPGVSGSGKSTFTAWLLSQGFDYLTDELVYIPEGSGEFQGFSRPMNLKNSTLSIFEPSLDLSKATPGILRNASQELVSPRALSARVMDRAHLTCILFLSFQPKAKFELKPCTKGQAGFALMQCLINARNLAGHGLPEAARLAQAIPAYRMSYSDFAQIGQSIHSILETDSV